MTENSKDFNTTTKQAALQQIIHLMAEKQQQQAQMQQQQQLQQHHNAEMLLTQQLQSVQQLVQQQKLLQQEQMQQHQAQQLLLQQQQLQQRQMHTQMRLHEEPFQRGDQHRAIPERGNAPRMNELVAGLQKLQAEQDTNKKLMQIAQLKRAMAAAPVQPQVQQAFPPEEEIQELMHMLKLQKQLIQQQAALEAEPGYVLDAAGAKRKQLVAEIEEQIQDAARSIQQAQSQAPQQLQPRPPPHWSRQQDAQPVGFPPGLVYGHAAARSDSALTDGCLPEMSSGPSRSRQACRIPQASYTDGCLPAMIDYQKQAPVGEQVPICKFTKMRMESPSGSSKSSQSADAEQDMLRWGAPPGLEHCCARRNPTGGYPDMTKMTVTPSNFNASKKQLDVMLADAKDWSDDHSTMTSLPMYSANSLNTLNTLNTLPDMKTSNTLPDMRTVSSLPELPELSEFKYLNSTA